MGVWEWCPFGGLGVVVFLNDHSQLLGAVVVALFTGENSVRRAGAVNAVEVGLAH